MRAEKWERNKMLRASPSDFITEFARFEINFRKNFYPRNRSADISYHDKYREAGIFIKAMER